MPSRPPRFPSPSFRLRAASIAAQWWHAMRAEAIAISWPPQRTVIPLACYVTFLFVGRRVGWAIPYVRFIRSDSHFVRVSAHVWRYDPHRITREEIAALRAQEHAAAVR